jgi:hypothetical protein
MPNSAETTAHVTSDWCPVNVAFGVGLSVPREKEFAFLNRSQDYNDTEVEKPTSIVSKNALLLGIPVPYHDSAVFGAGDNVAVLVDVTFGTSNARHHIKMAIDHLRHTSCKQKSTEI